MEQELPTFPKHLTSPPVFSGVRVTRPLVLCVCFVDRCLSIVSVFLWPLCCLSFFELRIPITPLVFSNSSSNYGFRLPLWYLQTLLRITDSDYHFGIFKLFFELRIPITPLVSSNSSSNEKPRYLN